MTTNGSARLAAICRSPGDGRERRPSLSGHRLRGPPLPDLIDVRISLELDEDLPALHCVADASVHLSDLAFTGAVMFVSIFMASSTRRTSPISDRLARLGEHSYDGPRDGTATDLRSVCRGGAQARARRGRRGAFAGIFTLGVGVLFCSSGSEASTSTSYVFPSTLILSFT